MRFSAPSSKLLLVVAAIVSTATALELPLLRGYVRAPCELVRGWVPVRMRAVWVVRERVAG